MDFHDSGLRISVNYLQIVEVNARGDIPAQSYAVARTRAVILTWCEALFSVESPMAKSALEHGSDSIIEFIFRDELIMQLSILQASFCATHLADCFDESMSKFENVRIFEKSSPTSLAEKCS